MMGMSFVPFSNLNVHALSLPRTPQVCVECTCLLRVFQVTNPGLTHDQYYTIALTALYLYDYLLTFDDEVFSHRTIQAERIAIELC